MDVVYDKAYHTTSLQDSISSSTLSNDTDPITKESHPVQFVRLSAVEPESIINSADQTSKISDRKSTRSVFNKIVCNSAKTLIILVKIIRDIVYIFIINSDINSAIGARSSIFWTNSLFFAESG